MKTILLIDGSNFLFRAYHALPPLTTKDGRPTGAIRGFLAMLKTLRKEVPTEYVACVFDAKGKTFRNDIYEEYKANRPPMPEDLRVQIQTLFEIIHASGIPLLQVPGIEADDAIGTIAQEASNQGFKVVIATGDKDYAQLVNSQINLINTMADKNNWLDEAGVLDKYGVHPNQIIDFLSLVGDKVDNVPGIDKCGPKTAIKWLTEYGSLENLIEHSESIKGKIGENLRNGLPFLSIAKNLVTIRCHENLSAYYQSMEDLKIKPANQKTLIELYTSLEFRRWIEELKKEKFLATFDENTSNSLFSENEITVIEEEKRPQSIERFIIRNASEAQDFLKKIENSARVAIYVLFDSDTDQKRLLRGLSISDGNVSGYVVLKEESLLSEGLNQDEFGRVLGSWLTSDASKSFFDVKSVRHVLHDAGIELAGVDHDVMLQSYILEAHQSHTLKNIAKNWLEIDLPDEEALLGKGVKKLDFASIAIEQASEFAFACSEAIFTLSDQLNAEIQQQEELERIYRTIEMPLSAVLYRMEKEGVLVDAKQLNQQTLELKARVSDLEQMAYRLVGEPFKLSSPKVLGEILFEKMGATLSGSKPKKTVSGAYSTSEEVLTELAFEYPLARIALEYRALTKLISTYTDKLPKMIRPQDGRIHTTFEQAVAVTGRLASSNPNLQNIPVRTAEGRRIREAFVAPKRCQIISADYSQIELRIMAHLSEDRGLIEAFNKGLDIHKATASEVFRITPEEVTADQRRIAKVVNFGLIYGMSAFGLAKNLGIDRYEAKDYITRYFEHFPGVRRYMDETRQLAVTQGYVQTVQGRKLVLPDIRSSGMRRAAAERAAINAPMQGTAADLIKMAMIAVDQWLRDNQMKSRMILQVHDELILEVPLEEVDQVKENLPKIMESVSQLKVPLIAELGIGKNWEAAH